MTETDLDNLEMYLDGALSESESAALLMRLAGDTEMAGVLDELRAQRSMRSVLWQSIEPDQATAERLTWRIRGAMADQDRKAVRGFSQWQLGRIGSVAAACVVFGFFAGWVGRGNHASAPDSLAQVPTPPPVVTTNVMALQPLTVPVTNEYGQVVAWQTFKDPKIAKDFIEDLHRANSPITAPAPDNSVRLMSAPDDREKY